MRVLWLLALLLAPPLVGCFDKGEEERLAVPTDRPIVVPTRVGSSPQPTVNLTDPGYRVNGTWRVGDGWDYESDRGRVLRVRVIGERNASAGVQFLVEEKLGQKGASSLATNTSWVDARTWSRLNVTTSSGSMERFQPGAPIRSFRNGTVAYNVTSFAQDGRATSNLSFTLHTRLRGPHQTLLFPWGYVEARVVDEVLVARAETGKRTQTNATRWVHADYLNDVQFLTPAGETFKLVAAKAGDTRRGTLAG